ncbi:hypothetical protein [Dethiobacter alkaliphilus]|uniref:hypothetical protein n=1 Tax=Dethiobacter alkaliphilus TaxID=427926 RepID=UPI000681D1F9|nr:hypothetical protein [Dethiobacter alkaliphilus]
MLQIKIKDRFLLGVISGLFGTIPVDALNSAQYRMGLTDRKYAHMAARFFTPKERTILGPVANETLNTSIGVMIAYALSASGRDFAALKGAGVGALYWFTLYGLTTGLGLLPKSKKPLSSILGFTDHLIAGATIGMIAGKLGDDSLFPDNKIKTVEEKTPLIFH